MYVSWLSPPTKPFAGFEPRGRKIKLIGVPMDTTTSYKPGSRFAPQAVRMASDYMELCSVFGDCIFEREGLDDLGNVVPIVDSVETTLRAVEEVVKGIASEGSKIITLGGDHTVSVGAVRGVYAALREPLCLCVVDAHLDLRNELCGRYSHATTVRRILESVDVSRVVWFGARAFSEEELDYLSSLGARALLVKSVEILEDPQGSLERVENFLSGCQALYLSIDIDGLDPAYAPGVQTPEPLGIAPLHLFTLVRNLSPRVVAADVVELAPTQDPSGITVALAVKLVVEIATGMLRSRR